ncbi:hypothetical protein ACFV2V_26540 [Streptomyces sp. NPDC059698]|uniref:hypothetical protein n=1 Tax=unclassified Streptomyces TaxID=2593676 RepID=UPI00093CFDA7|nr:hypothetical protein [Streptomyces sp. CB02366]OKJ33358.1 hypothetical protein AMK24_24050 [Streptomyces sp. CB02366]TVP38435.1 hypothetical protein A3L22_22750 [Streptomyces griseus subsp. griseus]WSS56312.1 hypothetical protein OG543_13480 [Streptomyces sp. NBC_01178]
MHEDPPAPARTTAAPRTVTRPFPAPATPAVAPRTPAGAAPEPAPASPDGPPGGHTTTTIERGSFCLARCSCGWAGPARRSRDRARTDAADHLAAP